MVVDTGMSQAVNTLIIIKELLCGMSEFSKKFFISDQLCAGETLAVLIDNERRFYSTRDYYFDAETCAVSPLDRATMIEWMFRRVLCVAPK